MVWNEPLETRSEFRAKRKPRKAASYLAWSVFRSSHERAVITPPALLDGLARSASVPRALA